MKNIFIILACLFSLNAHSQAVPKAPLLKSLLVGEDWRSDYNLFASEDQNEYHIFKRGKDLQFSWGNSVQFNDSTFSTSYSAFCGNDCFVSVYGNYHFVSSNTFEVYIDSVARNGMCTEGSNSPKKNYGGYEMIEEEKGYLIRKVKP
jgi:hypothetical protein